MSLYERLTSERLRTTISLVFCLFMGAFFLFGKTAWEKVPVLEEGLVLIGCVMASVGAFGRIWCSLYIAGYKNSVLVKDGPYSMTRNPLYFFSLVGAVGVGCATETLSIPLMIILAFALFYPGIIMKEQRRLDGIFGEEYAEYRRNVPAFFPSARLFKREPATYVVNPKTFTHNIVDAFWFIWLIGIFEFSGGLHEAGIIPVFFQLP